MDSLLTPSGADPIKVLLVDDHEHVLWGLRKLIEGEWPHMTVAGTAKSMAQALAAVKRCAVDVVVLDVYLGVTNSIDRIGELLFSGAPAVVMLTGSRDAELHRRALKCGARAVVSKHEPAEVLLGEIERVHRNAALEQTAEAAHESFVGGRKG